MEGWGLWGQGAAALSSASVDPRMLIKRILNGHPTQFSPCFNSQPGWAATFRAGSSLILGMINNSKISGQREAQTHRTPQLQGALEMIQSCHCTQDKTRAQRGLAMGLKSHW